MAYEFSFNLDDRPGTFAAIAEVLGNVNVNIVACAGISSDGQGLIKIIVDNDLKAQTALEGAGIQFDKKEIVLIELVDKPGELGRFIRSLANEGVNLHAFYITMNKQQVIEPDKVEKAKEIANAKKVLVF